MTVETKVVNLNPAGASCNVFAFVTDRNGNKIGQAKEQSLSLAVNGEGTIKQTITITDARRWSLEDPYLYRVKAVVVSAGKTIDAVGDRFGVRTLRFDATEGFFLNGKHVKIFGANNHQDHAGIGSALPDYLQYYRIELLKNMGVNACRTSHNPPTPAFLEACDSLGMLFRMNRL